MSLTGNFDPATKPDHQPSPSVKQKKKRIAPFSLRLSAHERARLIEEANGAPLGGYIKQKLLGTPTLRRRGSGFGVKDRQAFAQALALLGSSRISSNLNQLAHAVNIGVLPVTPETEAELFDAVHSVRVIRYLLIQALGLQPEAQP